MRQQTSDGESGEFDRLLGALDQLGAGRFDLRDGEVVVVAPKQFRVQVAALPALQA
jgi:hypothetical protein